MIPVYLVYHDVVYEGGEITAVETSLEAAEAKLRDHATLKPPAGTVDQSGHRSKEGTTWVWLWSVLEWVPGEERARKVWVATKGGGMEERPE